MADGEMTMVTLRNGAEVPAVFLRAVQMSLERALRDGQGVALYELLELAKDPKHVCFGNTAAVLEARGLLQHGELHGLTRDVVLASFDGDGLDAVYVDAVTFNA